MSMEYDGLRTGDWAFRPQVDIREYVKNLRVPWWKRLINRYKNWRAERVFYKLGPKLIPYVNEIHRVYVEGLREQFMMPADWEYRDIPWSSTATLNQLQDILGDENWIFVSGSSQFHDGLEFSRASIFISPAGMANLKAYQEKSNVVSKEA